MSIYITGDTHIPHDISKLSTKNWPIQRKLSKDDYLIICGDFGAVWDGSRQDLYWQEWLDSKSFTTLFVDGNHENHPLLSAYPVEGWRGGKVHSIQPSVLHLMRGQVFDIDGTSIFTMGGASSHDKEFRVDGRDWWQSELPSELEYEEAQENLERHSWNVDLVITHCAPTSIQQQLASWYIRDQLTNFLDVVVRRCATYQHWCFGHYHVDMDIGAQHHALYYRIWEFHK